MEKYGNEEDQTYFVCSHIFDCDMPFPFIFVPVGASHEMFELHVLAGSVFIRSSLDVLDDFLSFGIVLTPVWVVLEEELEAWRWDVTGYTRIFVL